MRFSVASVTRAISIYAIKMDRGSQFYRLMIKKSMRCTGSCAKRHGTSYEIVMCNISVGSLLVPGYSSI